ncbi:MAG: hypothetical protein Q9227_005616 [Pyrenula ochraceoflavens]
MECRSIFNPVQNNCNMWLANKHRHCLLPAGRQDERPYAERLRLAIVNHKYRNSIELFEMLEELAPMVHCRNFHRTAPQIKATVACWISELDESNRFSRGGSIYVSEAVLPPQTCLPQVTTTQPPIQILPADIHFYQTPRPILPVTTVTPPSISRAAPVTVSVPPVPRPAPPVTRLAPPVTRSQTANRPLTLNSRPPLPRFELQRRIEQDTPEAITDLVKKRFGHMEHKQGYIYAFTRDSDPGYIKIGWSTHVKRRMREWEQRCGYQPILIYQSPLIPNAYRVEQLIFTQLAAWRHNDMRCVNENICRTRHKEWFRIKKRDAKDVIRRWVEWAMTLPYDEDGRLEDSWSTYIDRWLDICYEDFEQSDLDLDFGCILPGSTLEDPGQDGSGTEDDGSHASSSSDENEHDSSSSANDKCAICMEELGPLRERTVPACTVCHNNPWHDGCIRTWIEHSSSLQSCPMCRSRDTIVVAARRQR